MSKIKGFLLFVIITLWISGCTSGVVKVKDEAPKAVDLSAAAEKTAAAITPTETPADKMHPTVPGTATPTNTPITEGERYYPIHKGDTWYFTGYKKKTPDKKINVKAEVVGVEQRDGKDYIYFYAPQVDIRYLMRRDKTGVYMRVIRYPFPFFNMSIEVELTPEMKIIQFPLKVGSVWKHKGRAEAVILGLFKAGRDIESDFLIEKKEIINTPAGKIESYHLKVLVNEGDGKPAHAEKYWYGKDTGYSMADTWVILRSW